MKKKDIDYPPEVYRDYIKRDSKIRNWNFLGTFAVGTLTGLVMEKNNIPYSDTDLHIAYTLAGSLNAIEYITNRVVKHYKLERIGDYIFNIIPDSGSFWLGDKFGRYVSRLL